MCFVLPYYELDKIQSVKRPFGNVLSRPNLSDLPSRAVKNDGSAYVHGKERNALAFSRRRMRVRGKREVGREPEREKRSIVRKPRYPKTGYWRTAITSGPERALGDNCCYTRWSQAPERSSYTQTGRNEPTSKREEDRNARDVWFPVFICCEKKK